MMRPRRRASDPGLELPDLNDDTASAHWVLDTATALEKATQASIDAQRDVVFAEDRSIRWHTWVGRVQWPSIDGAVAQLGFAVHEAKQGQLMHEAADTVTVAQAAMHASHAWLWPTNAPTELFTVHAGRKQSRTRWQWQQR